MKNQNTKIEKLISPVIENMGYIIWHMNIKNITPMLIQIYIDFAQSNCDKNISINDCSKVSKYIKSLLCTENYPILKNFILEISSPGIERFLYKPEHYVKYVGRKIFLVINKSISACQDYEFTCTLLGYSNNRLNIAINDQIIDVDIANVCRSQLKI